MSGEESAAKVKVMVLDVDGVLTDGSIVYDSEGRELKCFNIRDGHGIRMALRAGWKVVIMTGRSSPAVARRASELGVDIVLQGVQDKAAALETLLREQSWSPEEVAYVGDDLPDVPAMRKVGFPVAVSDAVAEVVEAAAYVTSLPGGRGAVREVVEFILKASGRWENAEGKFLG